jgi:hypothetical protein
MKLAKILQQPIGYNRELKEQFRKEAMKELRALAKALGLRTEDRDIRFNPGGIAVSGDAILHSNTLYVHISQSCVGEKHIYYRKVKSRKDYCGGSNFFTHPDCLRDPDFVKRLKLLGGLIDSELVK